ncbi:MAG: site-specific DNA-methyltransferase [Gammaproteobacteria bacterium]|nr:site-specific DNA-methyltransferase [Gammaproteobacteria bacterium]
MSGQSSDIIEEKLARLRDVVPEAFAEGRLDWEKLRVALGGGEFEDERYHLSWAGKAGVFRVLQSPTAATLAPCRGESQDFDNARHLFIEGENLEALKILQRSYFGKIKAIYIDPPYNTGNDHFVYSDRFAERKKDYLRRTGGRDARGRMTREGSLRKNSRENGHYHSNWLSMIYPRLFLARNLLREDGVFFVSIDDNEAYNLRMAMNEIFGEENFISDFAVIRAEGGGLAKQVIRGHDYLLAYARDITRFNPLKRPKDIRGRIIKENGAQYWLEEDWLRKEFGKYGTCYYEEIEECKGRAKKQEIDDGIRGGIYRLIEKRNGKHVVARLRALAEDGSKFYSILKHLSADGIRDLAAVGMNEYFDYPKPVSLLRELILGATFHSKNDGDIVLDFFAGSGTAAHAVLELNKQDGGNRRFICVQMPEPCGEKSAARKAGYRTIADIGKERIRRVIKNGRLNAGFKVFKLRESNFKQWRGDAQNAAELAAQMKLHTDSVVDGAQTEDILYELLLKSGVSLTAPMQDKGGWWLVDDGEAKIAVALERIDSQTIDAIMAAKPANAITLDRLFQNNDQLKTNTVLQMEDAGVGFEVV